MKQLLAILLFLAGMGGAALAVNPDEVLADPALEARAREISANLRCLVCQNQSIDDSDAELAGDLRVLVRERLTEGDSNEEVMRYVVDRYGEYVLLNPVVAPHTILLWLAAPAMLLGGLVSFGIVLLRRRSKPPEAGRAKLTDEEAAALAGLSESDDRKA
ncbi:cytochrome c-type biogenesis protein [Mariluticola halotolerans]|uniref:cytochrome c-type biogenesis protein n=1 Tax=Mariluticola halotolerans TaxID=2909283 RepID=UPI0026E41DDD|nr:cytochrome c-type biogenesis protein [Mariluticola halotolerans]UJQ95710.1 cytochrome c-type biogenesis protein CcmH [Mariluticola halotolerans]